MANRIVEAKEFRLEFRRQAEMVCDFSQKKSRHILGIGAKQINVDVAVDIIVALKAKYEGDGRTLDKALIDLHTPKGMRRYASEQLNQLARISPSVGANAIESLWRTFGALIPVARRGRSNIFVAKAGATEMEWRSVGDLKAGKTSAAVARDENVQDIVSKGRDALRGRSTAEAYAETCTEYFKAIPLQAAE